MLAKFLRLTWFRRRLLLRSLGWIVLIRLALPLVGFLPLCRWLRRDRRAVDFRIPLNDARWATIAAARRIPGATCLVRSLALQALLRRSSQPTELCIGVARRADGSLAAHAWVTYQGRPVLPDEDLSAYTTLPALSG